MQQMFEKHVFVAVHGLFHIYQVQAYIHFAYFQVQGKY